MPRPRRVAVIAFAAVVLVALAAGVSAAADTVTATPRCDGVKLRSAPSTAAAIRLVTSVGTQLTISGTVQGSSYSSLCAGEIRSGSSWDRVTAVDGTTVQSRFGVDALYVAAELVRVIGPVATPTTSPSPTPRATPTATPAPTATLAPTASPTESPVASPTPSPSVTPTPSPTATPAQTTQPAPAGTTQGPWSSLGIAVLGLAALSLVVSLLVIGDHLRSRRRARPSDLDGVSATRLEDVLH